MFPLTPPLNLSTVLRLLDGGAQTQDMALVHQTACMCVSRIADALPEIARTYFFPSMLGPFETFKQECADPFDATEDRVIVAEEEIDKAIERINYIVSLRTCSANVLAWVASVIVPLFRLFCLTSRSKSFLRSVVQNVLLVFFKTGTPETSAEAMLNILRPLHNSIETIAFCPGPSGGAQLKPVAVPTS